MQLPVCVVWRAAPPCHSTSVPASRSRNGHAPPLHHLTQEVCTSSILSHWTELGHVGTPGSTGHRKMWSLFGVIQIKLGDSVTKKQEGKNGYWWQSLPQGTAQSDQVTGQDWPTSVPCPQLSLQLGVALRPKGQSAGEILGFAFRIKGS